MSGCVESNFVYRFKAQEMCKQIHVGKIDLLVHFTLPVQVFRWPKKDQF